MQIIILLICASLLVAGGFLVAFIMAVRQGQFDDNYTPSVRILLDSDSTITTKNPKETGNA